MNQKSHRAVHIATGEISEVSDAIASDPNMMLEYGYMLQPLPEGDQDETEEVEETDPEAEDQPDATGEISEVSDSNSDWEKPLEYHATTTAVATAEQEQPETPAKRAYNRKK